MHESGNTKDEILQYIYTNEPVTAHMISDAFKIHPTMTHRHLKSLFERHLIKKKGTPPKVYYFINNRTDEAVPTIPLERALVSLLDEHYYQRGADGAQRRGAHGFAQRCQTNGHNLEEKALAFQKQLNTIDSMKKDGCIDMTQDFVTTFRETELTQVRHADFFSIPTFERTKLGNLVLYGKQTSDKELIHEAASIVEPSLRSLIQRLAIDHVGLIPHTDTTKPLLFLPTLRSCMNLGVNQLSFIKLFDDKPLAQKTLKKLNDRIINAQETIYLQKPLPPTLQNVLLIDDAASSGATLQVTAQKIKKHYPEATIYGFVIVSSRAGYEVITEI